MDKAKKIMKAFERAGFTIYNEQYIELRPSRGYRPYFCVQHPGTNAYSGLIYVDQPENTLMEILYAECKKVGRIQVRQELAHLINIQNYE